MRLSDKQIETLFGAHECPACGSIASPEACGHPQSVNAQWACSDEEECQWQGTVRELMEAALERSGVSWMLDAFLATNTFSGKLECVRPWVLLSAIHGGGALIDLLAAMSDDGIGVMARWQLDPKDGGWEVFVVDTEEGVWRQLDSFPEGEIVPRHPPVRWVK